MAKLLSGSRIYGSANIDGMLVVGSVTPNTANLGIANSGSLQVSGGAYISGNTTIGGQISGQQIYLGGNSNLLANSSNLNTASWGNSGTILYGPSANTYAPDGTNTVSQLINTIGGLDSGSSTQAFSLGLPSNTPYTFSTYLKQGNTPFSNIILYQYGGSNLNYNANINWSTNSIVTTGSSGALLNSSIVNAGGGWYRVSVTGTTGNYNGFYCRIYARSSTSIPAGDYVYIWGTQLEPGYFASQYIPTYGTAGVNNINTANTSNNNLYLTGNSFTTGTSTFTGNSLNLSNAGGINLGSNNTAVTKIIVSNGLVSGAFTSNVTATLSAPTLPGGITSTANTYLGNWSNSIVNAGSGYSVNDVITFVGGVSNTDNLQLQVLTVNGTGAILTTGIYSSHYGNYWTIPQNPISVTGGTGTGATFNASWTLYGVNIINPGSGYVEQPTVTLSGTGGTAAAYAVVGNSPTNIKSLYQSGTTGLSFQTPAGTHLKIGSAVGSLDAVNYFQLQGGSTNNGPYLSVNGSDTNVYMNLLTKGSGAFIFLTGTGQTQAWVSHTASSVNYLNLTGAITGYGPVLSAQGSDTNIPLVLQPKGTGALQAQQTDSTATGGNARGANAVDWQTSRLLATQIASGQYSTIGGGYKHIANAFGATIAGGEGNTNSGYVGTIAGGSTNTVSGSYSFVGGGYNNNVSQGFSAIITGYGNIAAGLYNFIGGGYSNSGTSGSAVTTQSGTMNGTTAVTLSGSNASIKVGQLITGTNINTFPATYVAAISGTNLTLSQAALGSSTNTLSFYTPHGVIVGGGNNTANGAYSFVGGGGDGGNASNRNLASADWSIVVGGRGNQATGIGSFVGGGGIQTNFSSPNYASGEGSVITGGLGNFASSSGSTVAGGYQNIANGTMASIVGGRRGTTRSINGNIVFPACNVPIFDAAGISQSALLILGRETTDATPTVLTSDTGVASTVNQIILPNNSAYYFKVEIVSGVTGGGNSKAWTIEGLIKRGANAASTSIVGTPIINTIAQDTGASTWTITATADTTNGGLALTFTGQAATTIRTVAQVRTTEMTY